MSACVPTCAPPPARCQSIEKRVPAGFDLVGSRKGFNRYSSPRRGQLVRQLEEGQKAAEDALTTILQVR